MIMTKRMLIFSIAYTLCIVDTSCFQYTTLERTHATKKRLHHHAEVKRQKLNQNVAVGKEQRKNRRMIMMVEGKGKPGIFFVSSRDCASVGYQLLTGCGDYSGYC